LTKFIFTDFLPERKRAGRKIKRKGEKKKKKREKRKKFVP